MTAVHAVDTELARLLTGVRPPQRPKPRRSAPVTARCEAALAPGCPSTRHGTSFVPTRDCNSSQCGPPQP
jgi:hypothetical protein